MLEFLELIPRLTRPSRFGGDPDDAFTVVAPSLPGFGLSFAPGQRRFSAEAMADCLAELMVEVLGYERFAAQGGDWGAFITARLGHAHADRLLGIHLNLLPLRRDLPAADAASPEERRYGDELARWLKEEAGYQAIQGTRPQTLAFALTDSPAGLAAWIVEKFRAWSDCDGAIESVFSRDELLANVALYWFTGAIGSSFWPYYARLHGPWPIPDGGVRVPTGYAAFPHEILQPPRSAAERMFSDIRRWTDATRRPFRRHGAARGLGPGGARLLSPLARRPLSRPRGPTGAALQPGAARRPGHLPDSRRPSHREAWSCARKTARKSARRTRPAMVAFLIY